MELPRCHEPFKLIIWHFPLKRIPTPVGVYRTMFPSHSIRPRAPVSALILPLGTVRYTLKHVLSENGGSEIYINAPIADTSLVSTSNTCFLFETVVSILVGSVSGNLSYCRRSLIGNTFHCIKVQGLRFWARLNPPQYDLPNLRGKLRSSSKKPRLNKSNRSV